MLSRNALCRSDSAIILYVQKRLLWKAKQQMSGLPLNLRFLKDNGIFLAKNATRYEDDSFQYDTEKLSGLSREIKMNRESFEV